MALQLTLSCDPDKTESGPTLIHSTGVEGYKIPPEVIRILQDNLTNDLLSDHEEGVLCQDAPQRILDILRQHGFTLQNQSNDEGKALWTVVQNGGGGGSGGDAEHSDEPNPTSNDDNEADPDAEDQGGDDGSEKKEGEGEEEEE